MIEEIGAALPLALARFLCRLTGHQWADPRRIDDGGAEYVYTTFCRNCPAAADGNWDAMEDIGAWRHYRSFR